MEEQRNPNPENPENQKWIERIQKMTEEKAEALFAEFQAEHPELAGAFGLRHFILVNGKVTEEPNFFKYGMWLENSKERFLHCAIVRKNRKPHHEKSRHRDFMSNSWAYQMRLRWDGRISEPFYGEEIRVSTVFIGISEDTLFETMAFGGLWDGHCRRYNTLGEAKQGHHELLALVREVAGWCARKSHGRRVKKWLAKHEKAISLLKKRRFRVSGSFLSSICRLEARLSRTPAQDRIHCTVKDHLRMHESRELAAIAASQSWPEN